MDKSKERAIPICVSLAQANSPILAAARNPGIEMTSATDDDAHEPLISNRLLFRITLVIGLLASLASALSVAGRWLGEDLVLGDNTESTAVQRITVGQDTLALPENVIRF